MTYYLLDAKGSQVLAALDADGEKMARQLAGDWCKGKITKVILVAPLSIYTPVTPIPQPIDVQEDSPV